jgi:hypothetical protein
MSLDEVEKPKVEICLKDNLFLKIRYYIDIIAKLINYPQMFNLSFMRSPMWHFFCSFR